MERIDLHMHSTVSDGTDTPAELLRHVREAGITLFALTDHDAVRGCTMIRELRTEDDPKEQRAISRDIDSHKDYMDAVKALNEKLVKLYEEPVEGLTRIDRVRFSEEIQKQDFKMSWFESLYPMFVLEKAKAKAK